MTWFLKLPDGTRHDLEDLPAAAYVAVEVETGQKWYEVSGNPYRHLAGALALMRQVLPDLGVTPPDPFKIKDFPVWFEWVDEDSLPTGGTVPTEGLPSPAQVEADEA